jgi:TAT (twin-arginine translocation) pathway signal sequence
MCNDHAGNGQPVAGGSVLSRRNFLHGTAAVAAGAALLRPQSRAPRRRLPLRSPARPVAPDSSSAYSMAMHVHSSFSEQQGSMDAQLFQAQTNSVDVLWWTDHDFRMDGTAYRNTVHFTSLTKEAGGPGQGGAWTWQVQRSGTLTSGSGGGIVSSPVTPNDPAQHGSLSLTAQTKTSQAASFGYYANCQPAGWNYRDNLTGQSLSIDVLLNQGWSNGYLEMLISTSYHEASAGNQGRVAQQNNGIITIPVTPSSPGEWTTVTITPSNDIAALWPDLDYRDFALWGLTLSAVSTGDDVSGYFDYLNFHRIDGGELFSDQTDMMTLLAARYPEVTQQQGLEVSFRLPHVNWFGSNVTLPSYGSPDTKQWVKYLENDLIPQIHQAGGLVSYNHPYGPDDIPQLPSAKQEELMRQVAVSMLPQGESVGALGSDLLEVGYEVRNGVDLAHHVGLWDVMSRNSVFLTGNGTSDDHHGLDWAGMWNNWVTSAWSASTGKADLLSALASGRAWCGSMTNFTGSLDLLVDGSCPMGSVTLSSEPFRYLTVMATGVPRNGSLQVLRGEVDYAGAAAPVPNTEVIASYTQSELASGQASLPVDNSSQSFVRTQVIDSAGAVVALSNPAWLLRTAPPGGIPGPRAA